MDTGSAVSIQRRTRRTFAIGIPSWSDKLLQEVMRLMLEAYYEPQFSERRTVSVLTEAVTLR